MLTRKQRQVIEQWDRKICKHASEVDPNNQLHWRSLFIGFAIGCGVSVDVATSSELYNLAFEKESQI